MAPQLAMSSSQIINEEADQNRYSRRWNEVVGIKFKPTAEVLAGHYLAGKVSGSTDGPIFPLIPEVDVYQCEPSKLKSKAYDFGDGNMYFFSRIQKKYKKGLIHDRKDEDGFWKTGKCTAVSGNRDDGKIATERSLTYFRNDPKWGKEPIKTHWLMKEYMLLEEQNNEESMTLCVVFFHDKKRRQRKSENEVLCDNENNQSSPPDVEEPEGSASSSYFYPNMPNIGSWVDTGDQSNVFTPGPNCNPPLYSTSHPATVTLEQALFFPPNSCQNITDIINGSWASIATALNNNLPLYKSNSNPAASTPERPSSYSYQNMQNMMDGSSGTPADSNVYTPNYCCSTFTELDLENWVQLLKADESLDPCFSNDDIQLPDLFEKQG